MKRMRLKAKGFLSSIATYTFKSFKASMKGRFAEIPLDSYTCINHIFFHVESLHFLISATPFHSPAFTRSFLISEDALLIAKRLIFSAASSSFPLMYDLSARRIKPLLVIPSSFVYLSILLSSPSGRVILIFIALLIDILLKVGYIISIKGILYLSRNKLNKLRS